MSVEEIKQLATTTQKRIGLVYALILAGLMIEMVVLAVGALLGLSAGDFHQGWVYSVTAPRRGQLSLPQVAG